MGDLEDRTLSRRSLIRAGLYGGAALGLTPLIAACGNSNTTPAAASSTAAAAGPTGQPHGAYANEKYVVVGFVPAIDYWKGPRAGLARVSNDLGVQTSIVGPEKLDQASQNDVINQVIQTKPDGIIVLPLDSVGVDVAVQAAMSAGIPTMTCLNGYNASGHQIGYLGFDRAEAGAIEAGLIAKAVKGPGTVAALIFNADVLAMQQGLKGFQDALAQLAPDLKVVVGVDNADPDVGTTVCGQLLQAHPDLKAFAAIDTSGGPSAARAVKAAGRSDVVIIAGGMGDHSTEIWGPIEDGTVLAALCEPSALDFYLQVQYLFNLNRKVTEIDWRTNPGIRVIPEFTNCGSFVVDKSNVAAMKALP